MSLSALTITHCITCGCEYAMPTALYNHQRESGGYHYCPNGHQQGWGEQSEINKVRRERDRLKQQAAQLEDAKRVAETRATEAEKKTAKLQKRVGHGMCPCCTRSFQNLARHMATKHPDVGNPNVVSLHKPKKAEKVG